MTAPDMMSIIAEAIRDSQTEMVDPPPGEYGRSLAYTTPEHQARAVLAAISEAGAVEWGVQWAGEDDVTEYQPSDKDTVTSALKADIAWVRRNAIRTPPKGELVSRIAGPWTAAEG